MKSFVSWCAALTSAFTISFISEAQESLSDLFFNSNCTAPCFLGIMPRQTTQQELETILTNNQIAYTREILTPSGSIVSYSFNPVGVSPLIWDMSGSVVILYGGVYLEEITISLVNVTVSDVINAFGVPSVIGNSGVEVTAYVYLDAGLAFFVDNASGAVTFVKIVSAGVNGLIQEYTVLRPCESSTEICQPSIPNTPTPVSTPILNTVIISDDDPIPSPLTLSEETRAWYNYTLSLSAPLTGSESVMVELGYYPPTPSNYAHVQTKPSTMSTWSTAQTLVFDANHTEYEVRIRARDDSTNLTGAVGRLSHRITASNVAGYAVNNVDSGGTRLTGSPFSGGNDASAATDSRNVLVFTVVDND